MWRTLKADPRDVDKHSFFRCQHVSVTCDWTLRLAARVACCAAAGASSDSTVGQGVNGYKFGSRIMRIFLGVEISAPREIWVDLQSKSVELAPRN